MDTHIKVIAVLYIVFGVMGAFAGIVVFTAVAGGGLISGDAEAIAITSTIGTLVGGLLLVLSVPDIIAGIGLLKYKEWARILTIVLGVLNLPGIPFGTALGVYTLMILFRPEAIELFRRGGPPPVQPATPPQPPGG